MKSTIIKLMPALIFIAVFIFSMSLLGPIKCGDGTSSGSIGKRGACSHHGGVSNWQTLVSFFLSCAVTAWYYDSGKGKKIPKIEEQPQSINENPLPKPKKKRSISNKCPKCKSEMVLRTAQQGRNAGGKFWGCSKYPRCKGTRHYSSELENT